MPLRCIFFIPPSLSCTRVTTKAPKAKRLLGERGGTVPSIKPRSEVRRTRFSRFPCVLAPCPMVHIGLTLEGCWLTRCARISIIAGFRAAVRVLGIPPLFVRISVMCYSASQNTRQGIRPDPCFVFFVNFWPGCKCRHFYCRCCSRAASRMWVSGSFLFLSFRDMLTSGLKNTLTCPR